MTDADRNELLALLARVDIAEDCNCPLDYDCPCEESCPECPQPDCPFCRRASCPEFVGPPPPGRQCRDHCRCCSGECDHQPLLVQQPCQHVLRPVDPSDEFWVGWWYDRVMGGGRARTLHEMVTDLRVALDPAAYMEPDRDLPDSTCHDEESRVAMMELRYARKQAIRHPLDRWRRDESSVGTEALRARNGSVYQGETRRA